MDRERTWPDLIHVGAGSGPLVATIVGLALGGYAHHGGADAMLKSGMAEGLNESYAALDRLLATLR